MTESFDPYFEWLGIPPQQCPPTYYQLIGITPDEREPTAIERAADERMAHLRKFQVGPRGQYTQALLNQLAAAKLCLLDPAARQRYDLELATPNAVAEPPAAFATRWEEPVAPPVQLAEPPKAVSRRSAANAAPAVQPPSTASQRAAVDERASIDTRIADEADGDDTAPAIFGPMLVAVIGVLVVIGAIAVWQFGLVSPRAGDTAADPDHSAQPGQPSSSEDPESSANSGNDEAPSDEPVVIVQEGNGGVNLTAGAAQLSGPSIKLDQQDGTDVLIPWKSPEDMAQWHFKLVVPGVFRAEVTYAPTSADDGGQFELVLDGEPVRTCELRGGTVGQFQTDQYYLAVKRSGRHTLAARQVKTRGAKPFALREVHLHPTGK